MSDHAVGYIEMGGGSFNDPFALYNWVQDGTGTLLGRGTSGSLFDALKADYDRWENYVRSDANPLRLSSPPIYSTQENFGGDACLDSFTYVINMSANGWTETQWRVVPVGSSAWGGWSIDVEVKGDSGFIYVSLQLGPATGTRQTRAYWDFDPGLLNPTNNTLILTMTPGSTTDHSLSINGVPENTTPHHIATDACSGFIWFDDPVNDGGDTNVFISENINGLACLRGPADFAYWAAYDWATHPGFA